MVWLFLAAVGARGEAMLQLFQVNWNELIQKMPEIAEAGYTSLWLPPPAKGGSVFSVGYDLFDPFDLGDKNQRGTVSTRYGTKAQLVQVVETAHRFGIRVYFDNIMNHRAFDVPGIIRARRRISIRGCGRRIFICRRLAAAFSETGRASRIITTNSTCSMNR
jgi:hypothetical protein